jgi:hypothetical protein
MEIGELFQVDKWVESDRNKVPYFHYISMKSVKTQFPKFFVILITLWQFLLWLYIQLYYLLNVIFKNPHVLFTEFFTRKL